MKPWTAVANSDAYRELSEVERKEAKRQYFESVVAPRVPDEERAAAWGQFKSWEPPALSTLDRAGAWLNDVRSSMQDDVNANADQQEAAALATFGESQANADAAAKRAQPLAREAKGVGMEEYLKGFDALNPKADDYDREHAAQLFLQQREAALASKQASQDAGFNNRFDEVTRDPVEWFNRRLDERLAGPGRGVVPKAPTTGDMQRLAASDADAIAETRARDIGSIDLAGESVTRGAGGVASGISSFPEAALKAVEGALVGLNEAGAALGMPEWMLDRSYASPVSIVAPFIEGKTFGSYRMAGTRDIADTIRNIASRVESDQHGVAIRVVSRKADDALEHAIKSGDTSRIIDVLSDPRAWAVGAGQAAPSLLASIVGGLPVMMAMEGGSALESLKEYEAANGGVEAVRAANAVIQTTALNTLLEKLGVDAAMGKLPKAVQDKIYGATISGLQGRIARGASYGLIGGAGEAGTEGLQGVNENLSARWYNPDAKLTDGVLLSIMGGAGSGASAGSVSGMVRGATQADAAIPDRAQIGARVDAGSVQNIGAASNVDEAIAAANAAAGEIINAPQAESFAVSQQQDAALSGLESADPLDATFARGQELGARIQSAPAPAQVEPLNAALASGETVSEEIANAPALDEASNQGSSDLPGGSAGDTQPGDVVGAGVSGVAGTLAPSGGTNQSVGERTSVADDALSQPEAAPIDQATLLESAARAASESQGQTLYRTPHKGLAMAQANRFRNSLGVPVEMSQAANGEWLVTRAQQSEQDTQNADRSELGPPQASEVTPAAEPVADVVVEQQARPRKVEELALGDVSYSRAPAPESDKAPPADDLLTLFNEAETIEIKAPEMSGQEIDDAEASFLSDFPEGSRYPRKTRLLERVRRESDRAFVQVKDAPGRLRRNARPLGPFSEYETRAEALEPDSFNPAGSLQVSVFGKEQVADGLIDEPALTITVTPDGDLTINGPSPAGETFREFQSRGWADRAKGAGGEVQPGWSALKDPANPDKTLPIQQIIPLLADVHARVRAWRGDEYVGLHWSRATGAMGGLSWGDQDTTAVYFSFAGQAAKTADARALATAKDRIASGDDAEMVRQETGWFRGADGKWRFEINDTDAKLKTTKGGYLKGVPVRQNEAGFWVEMPLSDLLDHPALFAAYPALADMSVTLKSYGGGGGFYRIGGVDDGGIVLNDALSKRAVFQANDGPFPVSQADADRINSEEAALGDFKVTSPEGALSTLLHEIQHGIQQIEGFATGGSPSQFSPRNASETKVNDISRKMADLLDANPLFGALRREQNREITRIMDAYGYDGKRGRALNWDDVPVADRDAYFARMDKLDKFPENAQYIDMEQERTNLIVAPEIVSPEKQYQRLAGEVEARNVQARQRMTDAERRATSPNATADVAESDVIVVFNGTEMANAPAPSNAVELEAGITAGTLRAAIAERMPSLSKAVDNMLARGEKGQRGGLVIIDSADEQAVADAVASKTGLSADESLEDVQASLRIFSDGVRRTGDFIVPETPEFEGNTSGDLAYLNDKPIRLTVGEHFQAHRGYGIVKLAGEAEHSSSRREPPSYTEDRAENFVRHVVTVANSADALFEEGGRMILRASRMREAIVLDDRGSHWSVISLRPAEKTVWGRPVRTGRGLVQSLSRRPASAPYQSSGSDIAPTPDRKSLGVRTEHFDLTNPYPDKQERIGAREAGKTVKVTVKKRRKIAPLFSSNGTIQGFYEKESGLTFLVGPNLTAETAPAVLLHEAIHGQQRADIDLKAMQMIDQRDLVAHPKHTREFMSRVYDRMVQAGAVGDATEAAAYIVEQAVIEGRQAGFSAADGKFMDWVDATLGKRIGNILRDFVAMIRGWAIRRGAAWNPTVDDLVAIAMAGVKSAARGDVVTRGSDEANNASDSEIQRSIAASPPAGAPPAAAIDAPLSDATATMTVKERVTLSLANHRGWALGALTRDQIADIYGKDMPQIDTFDRVVQAMDQERNKINERADVLVERWRGLTHQESDALADVMHQATLAQFDPDTFNATNKSEDALVAAFDGLGDDAKQVYRDVRDQYRDTLIQLRDALTNRVLRSSSAGQTIADEIRLKFDEYLKDGPYFSLARFGNFVLIADKGDDRIVESFESSVKREMRKKALTAMGWRTETTARETYSAAKDGASGAFVAKVLERVESLQIDAKEKADLMDGLNQLAIDLLPDASFRKHFKHRKGVPGFSRDAMRAFAASQLHAASHIARINHADELSILVDDAQENIKSERATGADVTRKQEVVNELKRRIDTLMNPTTHPVAAALGQVGFVMSLGGSVASGLVNLTQTPMVTFPWLGAKFGWGKASAALMAASKDYFGGRWDKWSGFVVAENDKLSSDERAALSDLEDAGLINLTQAHDLAGAANTDHTISRRAFAMNRAMKIVGWTFHLPEVFNRQVSALAAYRLAREDGQSHDDAVEAARQALIRTHFDYSASNRARFMQGNFTRVITMFKQYSQQMTYLLWRNAYLAMKDESPDVRKEARRMLVGVMSMHFAAAGSLGLPLGVFGVSPLLSLLALGMGDEDDPWDWEVEYRKMLADVFGKTTGEAIAHGPLRMLVNVDFASRVGLGDLWFREPLKEAEGRDLVQAWMLTLLGPVAGYAGNVGAAMQAFEERKYGRGLESLMPKFAAAPLKALRYGTEGVKSWKGDDLGIDLSGADVFSVALGFQPSRLAEMYEGRAAVKNRESRLQDRREEIVNMWVAARMAGDEAGVKEAVTLAMRFNKKNPAMRITMDTFGRSLTTKRRNAAQIKEGVYLPKSRESLRDEGRFANLN